MVTAYDAPSARIVDRAGAEMILIGEGLHNGDGPLPRRSVYRVQMEPLDSKAHLLAALLTPPPNPAYKVSVSGLCLYK